MGWEGPVQAKSLLQATPELYELDYSLLNMMSLVEFPKEISAICQFRFGTVGCKRILIAVNPDADRSSFYSSPFSPGYGNYSDYFTEASFTKPSPLKSGSGKLPPPGAPWAIRLQIQTGTRATKRAYHHPAISGKNDVSDSILSVFPLDGGLLQTMLTPLCSRRAH